MNAIPVERSNIRVSSCGSRVTESILIEVKNKTVHDIKAELDRLWDIPSEYQVLVCCGEILQDHVALEHLVVQIQQEENLWMVFRNVWLTCNSLKCVQKSFLSSDYPGLRCIFDLSGSCKRQMQDLCCVVFFMFCSTYGVEVMSGNALFEHLGTDLTYSTLAGPPQDWT